MRPIGALNEIAFWLERERAPLYKVQAFRKAAAALAGLEPGELERRANDGSLREVKAIGARSFEIVTQVIGGDVPDYLASLRASGAAPLVLGGKELLSALRGDLHCHSDWSDGWSPIDLMIDAARQLGREYIALTDHSPSLRIAHGLTAGRLAEQLDVVSDRNERSDGVRLLTGIEVDILETGDLDQTPELLDRLDIVVASVHSKLRADRETMTGRMLAAIRNPHTNILGHCTGRLLEGSRGTRPESQFDARAVFAACAEHAVAVEINSRPERQDPPDDLIAIALDAGCLFSIDSDAHAPGHLDFIQYGAERAAANAVPTERIITTWPAEQLLTWARTGR